MYAIFSCRNIIIYAHKTPTFCKKKNILTLKLCFCIRFATCRCLFAYFYVGVWLIEKILRNSIKSLNFPGFMYAFLAFSAGRLH